MKATPNLIAHSFHRILIIFSVAILLVACLTSCDNKSAPPQEIPAGSAPVASDPPPPVVAPVPVEPTTTATPPITDPKPRGPTGEGGHGPVGEAPRPTPTGADDPAPKKSNLENYSVQVSADKQLFIPASVGEMKVWIGIEKNIPTPEAGMNTVTESLNANAVGETAKITPFTKGVDVEVVPNQSLCIKIDPSGSEVRFKLIPKSVGTFIVSADINLYDSKDCSGAPVPKTAKRISVEVIVNKNTVVSNALGELGGKAWKAFLDFWDKLLVIFFTLILFLLRKRLYRWFRFKGKE